MLARLLHHRNLGFRSSWRSAIWTRSSSSSSSASESVSGSGNSEVRSDVLISGLNADRDIMVRVVACRELLQENMIKNDMSPQAARLFAEVTMGTMMMGCGMKDEESLQLSLVGSYKDPNGGEEDVVGSITCITDGSCVVRSTLSSAVALCTTTDMEDVFGKKGTMHVVRQHPNFKQPVTGSVRMLNTDIASNLEEYMKISEQRSGKFFFDVLVDGALCRHALAILVEQLPGASDNNIQSVLENLQAVKEHGLRCYLTGTGDARSELGLVLDTVLGNSVADVDNVEVDSTTDLIDKKSDALRWSMQPEYRCTCSIEKIWRTLKLLPTHEIEDMVTSHRQSCTPLQIKCEFCGVMYSVGAEEMQSEILASQ